MSHEEGDDKSREEIPAVPLEGAPPELWLAKGRVSGYWEHVSMREPNVDGWQRYVREDLTSRSSVVANERRFPICEDHQRADWNQPDVDDALCILCRLLYLEAQESLLEEWQQRAKRAEDAIAEIQRPLDEQMARLNATVARLNGENERLETRLSATAAPEALGEQELTELIDYHDNQDAAAEAMGLNGASLYHANRSKHFSDLRDAIQKRAADTLAKMVKPESYVSPRICPYCTSDNEAVRSTYYDQTCEGCVKRMGKP